MTQETNPFGGKNPNSLYVPMSETEQEVLDRLVTADDIEVHIIGWGVLHTPKIRFGDKRVSIRFQLSFNAPAIPTPVYYFDLELRTRAGLVLFAERHSAMYDQKPISVSAGMHLDMIWDIAIHKMSEDVVKMIKPGAVGLTSRVDNMHLKPETQAILKILHDGEASIKASDARRVAFAEKKEDDAVKTGEVKKLVVTP